VSRDENGYREFVGKTWLGLERFRPSPECWMPKDPLRFFRTSPSAPDGCIWVASSLKLRSEVGECVSVVAFQRSSTLEMIGKSALGGSGLKLIVIPSVIVVLGRPSFSRWDPLESVTRHTGPRLERIDELALYGSDSRLPFQFDRFREKQHWLSVLTSGHRRGYRKGKSGGHFEVMRVLISQGILRDTLQMSRAALYLEVSLLRVC
jgi:hypothetical protein